MNQFVQKKVFTLLLAVCLIVSNLTMAFAGPESTPVVQAPSLTAIDSEIATTAQYLKTSANINAATDFYNSSKLLILLLRSGINCSDLIDSYLSQVSAAYISNGELNLADPLTDYAYLSIILTLSGRNATNFNGINLIEKYETAIANADQVTLNNINPYKLPHMYTSIYAYAKEFKDSATCLTKIKIAVLSYENENGIDYWGNSTDNNGFALAGLSILSSSDSGVKKLAENALIFSQTLLQSNGTSNGDFKWSAFSNSDSTAASLTLYATYGKQDLAANSYAGLLTFKNSLQTGAYSYTNAADVASSYSTIDALYSLLTYKSILANQSSPFDVSDKLASISPPVINPEPETTAIAPPSTVDTTSTIATSSSTATPVDLTKTSPATGDSNIPTLFFLISLLSACGIITLIYIPHYRKQTK